MGGRVKETIEDMLDRTIRQLISDLNDAADPVDKEKLAAAIKHLQAAKKDGLTGVTSDDPISRLVEAALEQQSK
jgi:DNA-binding MurR/RpiR family transcriptional regulator